MLTHANTNAVPDPVNNTDSLRLNEVPNRLHSAQQDLNQLRLLNVCLQSTLFRIQNQLVEYLPSDLSDEVQRTVKKQKLAELRHNEDHVRRNVSPQQLSFAQMVKHVKSLFDQNSPEPMREEDRLDKYEKQALNLHEIFQELNTMIHTQHHDRICQLYLTLAQTTQSVEQARQSKHLIPSHSCSCQGSPICTRVNLLVLDQTVRAHRRLARKRLRQRLILILTVVVFFSVSFLIIVFSIRRH